MNKNLSFMLVFLAFLVALHQYVYWGVWWQWEDLHHETFIVALTFGGVVSYWLLRRGRKA